MRESPFSPAILILPSLNSTSLTKDKDIAAIFETFRVVKHLNIRTIIYRE
jgi:hypothetical protein